MKTKNFNLSLVFLKNYCLEAVINAESLFAESKLLFKHCYYARSYFVAIASIEETGKAVIAFDAQGRKLANSRIATKIRRQLADHAAKINSSFLPWVMCSDDIRRDFLIASSLSLDLSNGRETSLYVDVAVDSANVQSPLKQVSKNNANGCLIVADNVLTAAKEYIKSGKPIVRSTAEDAFLAMSVDEIYEIISLDEFTLYWDNEVRNGRINFVETLTRFHKSKYKKTIG